MADGYVAVHAHAIEVKHITHGARNPFAASATASTPRGENILDRYANELDSPPRAARMLKQMLVPGFVTVRP